MRTRLAVPVAPPEVRGARIKSKILKRNEIFKLLDSALLVHMVGADLTFITVFDFSSFDGPSSKLPYVPLLRLFLLPLLSLINTPSITRARLRVNIALLLKALKP
jgi:hypothetical protein